MTRVGVISDTHGLLRPEARYNLRGVAHILHAGDIGSPDVIPCLEEIAPVTAIRGNIDQDAWAEKFGEQETLEIAGHKIFILHNRNDLGAIPAPDGVKIVISGHSHKPLIETIDGILYLNPGSAGPRRFTLPIALATIEMTADSIVPQIHEISA